MQRPLPWRTTYDPWEVWVSEVMLQQTRMTVVVPYFERFIRRFPSVGAAAGAAEEELLAHWSGLGYYRRATMLHRGARAVMEQFGGVVPSNVRELLLIPGIGRYTAGAIASIAFQQREPLVDGNVARVFSRLYTLEHPVGSASLARAAWEHAESLVSSSISARNLNQGVMELGALICTPKKPSCPDCPVAAGCIAHTTGRTAELPHPKERPATQHLSIPLYVVSDGAGRVLMRREDGRLMRAMYHLPHGDASLLGGDAFNAGSARPVGMFRHTITTRRIEFTVYDAAAGAIGDSHGSYEWIETASLDRVPHPSYVRKALKLWRAAR